MISLDITPREDWENRVCKLGFDFFEVSQNYPYWVEDRYYQFSREEIEQIDAASEQLHDMCISAIEHVFRNDLLDRFGVPRQYHRLLRHSWETDKTYLYGRFDFSWGGGKDSKAPKMLEYNAQTPTSLFEAAVVAWDWMRQNVDLGCLPKHSDQFNLLDEQLIVQFERLLVTKQPELPVLHFIVCEDSAEDLRTVQYLAACAEEAGWETVITDVNEIQLTVDHKFADHESRLIYNMFMLYPYEFALLDDYAQYIEGSGVTFIEPLWKVLLSSKALLPILWELYPGHENLLPCYYSDDPRSATIVDKVKKPIYSREGANITIEFGEESVESSGGNYGEEGFITQQYWPLASFGHGRCVIGSWIIGRVAAGLSVRESKSRITDDVARFVPHIFI